MKAGAAVVDITPKPGVHLGGSVGGYRASQVVLDPLYARAAVFSNGDYTICLLALDVIIITREYTDHIRAAAAERFGLEPEAIMVHATHTHSAPSLGHFMVDDKYPTIPADKQFVRGGDLSYAEPAADLAVEAIGQALANMEKVTLGTGSGAADGIAFNRRAVMRDGKVTMPWLFSTREHPAGRSDILHLEGPVDPEVGILATQKADGRLGPMLLTFSCHPVNQFTKPSAAVSADWPGAWAHGMTKLTGAGSQAVVLNGCGGNINPIPPFQPDFVPDHRKMGRVLTNISFQVLETLQFSSDEQVDFLTRNIQLKIRQVDADELAKAEEYLAQNSEPPWLKDHPELIDPQWSRAAWLRSIEMLRQRSPEVDYEIQVFRIGGAAFVSLPGEPFIEGQLAIKQASPFRFTQVVHCTTQYIAYFPTREAYPRGGHETFFCKVVPGSLEQIVEAASEMLQELHGRI
jgi:neutral ceramidase